MKPVEYEFVLPDGTKFYEIVCERGEAFKFMRMHGAISAMPVPLDGESDRKNKTPIVRKMRADLR